MNKLKNFKYLFSFIFVISMMFMYCGYVKADSFTAYEKTNLQYSWHFGPKLVVYNTKEAIYCLDRKINSPSMATCTMSDEWDDKKRAAVGTLMNLVNQNIGSDGYVENIDYFAATMAINCYAGQVALTTETERFCTGTLNDFEPYPTKDLAKKSYDLGRKYFKILNEIAAARESYITVTSPSNKELNFTKYGDYYEAEFTLSYPAVVTFSTSVTGGEITGISSSSYQVSNENGIYNKFRVRIPVSSVSSGQSITVRATFSYARKYTCIKDGVTKQPVSRLQTTYLDITGTIPVITGSLKIKKVDEDDGTLITKSAKFSLYKGKDCSGDPIHTNTTSNGQVYWDNLLPGTYSVREVEAPDGYQLPSNTCVVNSIEIYAGSESSEVRVPNKKEETGTICVIKMGKGPSNPDGIQLNGATFVVTGNGKYYTLQPTDKNKACTPEIPLGGGYTLKEKYAPAGYQFNTTYSNGISITLSYDGEEHTETVWNDEIVGSLTIVKRDQNEKAYTLLNGAKFKLYKGTSCSGSPLNVDGSTEFTVDKQKTITNLPLGTYSICETKAPDGYQKSDTRYEVTLDENHLSQEVTVRNKKLITLRKIDSNLRHEINQPIELEIYDGKNCDIFREKVSFIGNKTDYALPISTTGWYSFKETKGPKAYISDSNECKLLEVNYDDAVAEIENTSSCESIFNSIDPNSIVDRVWAYNFLRQNHQVDYRGMLVVGNSLEDSCKTIDVNPYATTSCLSGTYETNKVFNENNLSLYNEIQRNGNVITFCLVSFKLDRNPNLNGPTWYVNSGRMPIQKLTYASAIAATGTLNRKCYAYEIKDVYDKDTANTSSANLFEPEYDEYIKEVKFDGNILKYNINNSERKVSNFTENTLTATYYLNEIFAKIGSGEISYSITDNERPKYKSIGYGVVSKFNSKNTYYIPYSLTLGNKFPLSDKDYNSNNTCEVIPDQEIIITDDDPKISDELRLEFRIVDTSNPFPGISGNKRLVGSNWRSISLDFNNDGIVNTGDLNLLTLRIYVEPEFTGVGDFKWDVNKDGKLDDNDLKYLEWVTTNSSFNTNTNNSLNPYIAYIMETTNNSYNKDNEKPKYTITLTPDNIKKIREYNETHKYDDFTLNCTNGDNCEMDEFSSYLNNIGVTINN